MVQSRANRLIWQSVDQDDSNDSRVGESGPESEVRARTKADQDKRRLAPFGGDEIQGVPHVSQRGRL
jgi:hypothetical protein